MNFFTKEIETKDRDTIKLFKLKSVFVSIVTELLRDIILVVTYCLVA